MINQDVAKKRRTSTGTFIFGPFGQRHRTRLAFTLLELMVVIMIVSILAAVAVPILQGRVDSAKWSEANAAAGTIRTAVSAYVAHKDIDYAQSVLMGKRLDDSATRAELGFIESDLTGTYFVPGDYTIAAIDAYGHATVEAKGSRDNAPQGTKTLFADGSWQ
jgi:prepilin-type N-terminal cleavage/methylation domain-containing protein